jgi:hypothetical protein
MDLKDLYQDLIIDHNRSPRNFRKLLDANHRAEGFNPLCGDKLTLYVNTDGERISDIAFEGSGCAISVARFADDREPQGKTEAKRVRCSIASMRCSRAGTMPTPTPRRSASSRPSAASAPIPRA